MRSMLEFVAYGIVGVVFAYAASRAASVAYFRTKMEHLRSTLKVLQEGEDNAEG